MVYVKSAGNENDNRGREDSMKTLMSILIGLFLMFSLPAYAEADTSTGEQSVDLETTLMENILTSLRENAPNKFKQKMGQISYKIINSNDPTIIRVKPSNSSPVIEISTGAFMLLMELAYADAASVFIKDGSSKNAKWILTVGKNIKEGKFNYPTFLEFTGDKEPTNEYFSEIVINNLLTSLSFILAHECSHVLLGHLKELRSNLSHERIQFLEYKADDLAVDILVEVAGNNAQAYVFYGTGYLQFFNYGMALNLDILGHPSMREHPQEPERAVRMARKLQKNARSIFDKKEEIEFIEHAFNYRIREYIMYKLVLEYQEYLYTPDSEDLSFEEWHQEYGK